MVNIKPAANMADRYYDVTLIAEAKQARQTTNVGVRIEEPKWMWVGAGITVLIIAGFIIIFLRLGRGK